MYYIRKIAGFGQGRIVRTAGQTFEHPVEDLAAIAVSEVRNFESTVFHLP